MTAYKMARTLARIAHTSQVDKAGQPYFGHVERVAARCRTYEESTVAYLHDIVEDTSVTFEDLRVFFEDGVVRDVQALTRRKGEPYRDYIERIIQTGSPTAINVKLADLHDNLDPNRAGSISDDLRDRYFMAKERLEKFREAIAQ